jgi:hypothetical protein
MARVKACRYALRPGVIEQVFRPDRLPMCGVDPVCFPGRFNPSFLIKQRNRTRVPFRSAQAVPDPAATAMLIQRAALDQRPEMLLERVAAGSGQPDGLADGDAPVFAGELDDL